MGTEGRNRRMRNRRKEKEENQDVNVALNGGQGRKVVGSALPKREQGDRKS